VYQIPEKHNFYYEDILNRPLSADGDWYLGGGGGLTILIKVGFLTW